MSLGYLSAGGRYTARWSRNWPTRHCTVAGYGSSMSTVVWSAVASSKTGSACGRRASAMSWWNSAVPCITSGCASRPGNG